MLDLSPSSAITCQFGALQSVDVDLLVLPWFEGEGLSAFDGLDRAASGEISLRVERA